MFDIGNERIIRAIRELDIASRFVEKEGQSLENIHYLNTIKKMVKGQIVSSLGGADVASKVIGIVIEEQSSSI